MPIEDFLRVSEKVSPDLARADSRKVTKELVKKVRLLGLFQDIWGMVYRT